MSRVIVLSDFCPCTWKSKEWAVSTLASQKSGCAPRLLQKTANRAEKMVVIHERGGALANISSPSFFYHPNGVNEPQFHYEAIEMSSAAVSSCS